MSIGNIGNANAQGIDPNANQVGAETIIARNPELGNVHQPSKLALAGRILLGIFSLGISEGIRALVNKFSSRPPAEPRIASNIVLKKDHGPDSDAVKPKQTDSVDAPQTEPLDGEIDEHSVDGLLEFEFTEDAEGTIDQYLPSDEDIRDAAKNDLESFKAYIKDAIRTTVESSKATFPVKEYREIIIQKVQDAFEKTGTLQTLMGKTHPSEMLRNRLEGIEDLPKTLVWEKLKLAFNDSTLLAKKLTDQGIPLKLHASYINLIQDRFNNDGDTEMFFKTSFWRSHGTGESLQANPTEVTKEAFQRCLTRLMEQVAPSVREQGQTSKPATEAGKFIFSAKPTATLLQKGKVVAPKFGKQSLQQSPQSNTCFMMSVLNAMLWNKSGAAFLTKWFGAQTVKPGSKYSNLNEFESYLTDIYRQANPAHIIGDSGDVDTFLRQLGLKSDNPVTIHSSDPEFQRMAFWSEASNRINKGDMAVILDPVHHHYRTIIGTNLVDNKPYFLILDSFTGKVQNTPFENVFNGEGGKGKQAAIVTFFSK